MAWVLDGNNLAGGMERSRVRQAALDLARRERVRIVVFFDGAPPPGVAAIERLGAVEVRYVADADVAIVALVGRGGQGLRVATDDQELARRVRGCGGQVVGGKVFWEKVRRTVGDGGEEARHRSHERATWELDATVERLPEVPGRVPRRRPWRRRMR